MPQRPATLTERLRSVWSHASELRRAGGAAVSTGVAHTQQHRGSDFAARLRAAVTARH